MFFRYNFKGSPQNSGQPTTNEESEWKVQSERAAKKIVSQIYNEIENEKKNRHRHKIASFMERFLIQSLNK